MYKNLILVTAIAAMPFSKRNVGPSFIQDNSAEKQFYAFHFKSELPSFITRLAKKTSAPYTKDWLGEAQENIRKSEYQFTWEEKLNAYCTPNRENNLRFYYDDKGFTVEPRTTKVPIGDYDPLKRPDEIKYRSLPNWKVKFNLDKIQVGKGSWKIAENKAEYIAGNITVQYHNTEDGMRQNFIVRSPLSKSATLKINLAIKTKLTCVLNGNRLQFLHKKNTVLNYEDLKVWDANNKPLGAVIKKNKRNKYFIAVNTAGATYPITIDPISTTPAAMVQSNQALAHMGNDVSSAGDVNGDGYSDVIVGAVTYDNGQTNEGAAFVYHGTANGINTIAASMLESNQVTASMGYSVASAGDVNADGYSDVIVGVPNYNNGHVDEGAAFIYHGSASGINTTPAIVLESNQANALLGVSVAGAGDVNGDGYSDVIVGAFHYDFGQTDEGAAFVYHGSASGITGTVAAFLECNQVGAEMGRSVASAGDVNGDGYSDVIVGAISYDNGQTDEGAAFVYHGSPSGVNTTLVAMVESNHAGAEMGWSVASAGDVNGDGYSDVIVGAINYQNGQTDEGAAFVYHGSVTGISTTAVTMMEGNQPYASFGSAVVCAGDVNGDGYSDVVIGASYYDNGQTDEGAAFVYFGTTSGINASTPTLIESNQFNANMGCSVASAGDVNGDGYSDVIVGAINYENGQTEEGAAFVYHGSPNGISTTPNNTPDDADQITAAFAFSVASAGDVNGDGYSDVIIGAELYDDGAIANEGRAFVYYGSATGLSAIPDNEPDDANQSGSDFGISVASAGDVNADGYDDVIIGAALYDDGPNTNEGVAFVYYGSASGLSAAPNSILDDANQANADFGNSVAGAGDVNGDGYNDVIIGAIVFDDGANTDEGRAFVYYGSITGLSASPNSTPDDANQAGAEFGYSVASAGDVNGDGYSDVIIGAIGYNDAGFSDEGRAFVYYGSSSGLSASPNSTPDDADQPAAQFGTSVASAGDVNGDGCSDVVIGAPNYNDGANNDEGRAFVYYGSTGGLSATPNVVLDDADQGFAEFGYSVACAGDVNGDGYSDVIVGAPLYDDGANANEGRAFVYHGSKTGLSSSPNSIPDNADQLGAQFGHSVACAGDINGDGYSDLIIGAVTYDDGANTDEGRAFLYNGNDFTTNLRNNLRLYNSDLTTPVNNSNYIFGNFGAGLFAKSFLGRAKGKMVWETRLNYNAYSGNPITNSTVFTSQQSSYTDLSTTGIELKGLITKLLGSGRFTKLRARVKYDPVTAITGQVYGPWRNASSIIDANGLGVLPIELISFKASWIQKGKTAQLNFITDKESGICCFDIEKSLDGFNFSTIGTLPAKNITGIQSYSFVDNNAVNKIQFYRLKIKGTSGQIEYSNIQQLQYNATAEILVFPNPATDVLQLQLNAVYDKMNVQIINTAGQIVKQLNGISAANQSITIPVNNLPAGCYWLFLQSGAEKQVLQFIKL